VFTAMAFRTHRGAIAVILLAVMLVALPPLAHMADNAYLVSLFTRVLIYALAAVSLDLILGFGGMVSLGHAAFFGAGAYVVGVLAWHAQTGEPFMTWPVVIHGTDNALIAWPLAALVAGLAAWAIGAVCLRTRGIHFIMITLAFAQMLFYFFVSLEAYGGEDGLSLWGRNRLPGLSLYDRTTFYYLCLAILALFTFLSWKLIGSRFGMVIRGCRQNERRMQALGYATFRYKLACFVIAGAGAGLAGALIVNQTEYVGPSLLHWTRSGEILIMVILGGMGTLFGPIVGAAVFLLMEYVLIGWTEHWMIVFGPFLVLVVLFARRGLWGWIAGGGRGGG
jgi:branched-chain amino acid transport system permease protein